MPSKIRTYHNGSWFTKVIDTSIMPTLSPKEIEAKLYNWAEEYSVENHPADHRHHLGISIIGEECWRKLWYSFRWVKLEQHEGRMRRLFNRGHKEEANFKKFLSWTGFEFRGIDPATDKPYKLSLLNGHYGGEPDDISVVGWLDGLPILCEYKTHNDKSFTELKAKKVNGAKPQHFAQMCGYGKDLEIKHALYCAVNKNTDEWYFEFVELDWNRAVELENKAKDIIYSKVPPARINENPSYWKCKFCSNFKGICHDNEPIERNCRSCVFASPGEKAEWVCEKYGQIPRDFLKVGCGEWKGIV